MLNTCQLDGISLKKFAIYFAITGKYSIFALVIGSFWTIRAKNQFCIQFVTSTIQEPVKYLTYRGLGVTGSHPSLSAAKIDYQSITEKAHRFTHTNVKAVCFSLF